MLESSILLISDSKSFVLMALISALNKAEIKVTRSSFNMDDMSTNKSAADIVVVYLDSDVFTRELEKKMFFIRDFCMEESKSLFVIGNPSEITDAENKMGASSISEEFERPFNSEDIINKINEYTVTTYGKESMKKILVIDDDVMFLKTISSWLEDKYRVVMANSGMRAITYLANNRPDLILLDYEMPTIDGVKLMQMIHGESETSDIPVIFLTGKSDRESVGKVIELHPAGYILKSQGKTEIVNTVHRFFDKSFKESVPPMPDFF